MLIALVLGCRLGAWSQSVPVKDGSMLTPPPVSVDTYPKEFASEVRSNYLRLGATFSAGYIDNLYPGTGSAALAEKFFSIRPTIAFDATSYRQQSSLLYTPGFTFYQPTSSLNETDQNLIFNYRFRLTPHGVIEANDVFQQGAGSFNPYSSASGGISGSTSSSGTVIIAPFAQHLTNVAKAQYSLQLSPTSMVGVSGRLFDLHYPDPAQVPGLYDSHERGGGAFYNLHISGRQYFGLSYRYARILTNPTDGRSETQTHSTYLFYSIYPKPSLSISAAAGPQEYNTETSIPTSTTSTTSGLVTYSDWTPSVTASIGWQGTHTSLAASYSRSVTAGEGLQGPFQSNSASGTARWQALRTWTFGATASYSISKNVIPLTYSSPGGHTIAGLVTVDHPLNANFGVMFEYDHLHQSYAGVPAVTNNPDSNRETISIYWQLSRPLGR